MRINTNFSALTAFNALNSTNKSLKKVINSLSTGLRINSSADDAAGFAVAEKMRSQISGLNTASRNTQDGISLLQTAEGALSQTNSMLQRMRELAVQASNDSLTSNDRKYLQLEIDELKGEIDRIADTTQFNKKRLLDGSCGALWSSSDLNVKAKINGGLEYIDEFGQKVNSEGNYRIEISAEPGLPQVQKNNIINYREITSQEIKTIRVPDIEIEQEPIESEYIINLETMLDNSAIPASSGEGWEFTTDDSGNNYLRIYGDGKFNITGTTQPGMFVKVESSASDALIFLHDVSIDNSTRNLPGVYIEPGAKVDMYLRGDNTLIGGGAYSGLGVPDGAELTLSSFSGDGSTEGTLTTQGGSDGGAGIGAPNYPARSGRAGKITINGGTINATGGDFGGAGIGGSDTTGGAGYNYRGGGTITINGGDITAKGGGLGYFSEYSAGAGIGTSTPASSYGGADGTEITITGGKVRAYGASVTSFDGLVGAAGIGGGADADSGKITIKAGLVVSSIPSNADEFVYAEAGASDVRVQSIGYGCFGRITTNPDGTSAVNLEADIEPPAMRQAPDLPIIITGYEETERIIGYHDEEITVETNYISPISEISQFYSSSGVLTVAPYQTITITQGAGQSAEITLYPSDTMYDVANKINDAIANSLGQSKYTNNPNKFCTISDGTELTSESVYTKTPIYDDKGNLTGYDVNTTMLIRSAIPGKSGELYFSGDEDLLHALGLNTIQASSETTYTASVYDAHTGQSIAQNVKSSAPEFPSLIPPEIDIEVDMMSGLSANWDENTKRFMMARKDTYTVFLHLKNNGTIFQTGSNRGEDFMIQLGDASCDALNLASVNVVTRETASRSIGILDRAINHIASQRAKIGAYDNALERTMNTLTVTSTNLTDAESRISDADIASSFMDFVKLQILNQSGTSMLAQANQLPQSVMGLLQ